MKEMEQARKVWYRAGVVIRSSGGVSGVPVELANGRSQFSPRVDVNPMPRSK